MTDLKTVLVDALNASALHDHTEQDRTPYVVEMATIHGYGEALTIGSGYNALREWGCGFDADRLAQAIEATIPMTWLVVGSGCSQGCGGGGLYGAARTEQAAQVLVDGLTADRECLDHKFWVEPTPLVEGLTGKATDRPIHD